MKDNYLALVEYFMEELGYDEDLACRLADYELCPETYCADDYDC
jgi:hypothetical protein